MRIGLPRALLYYNFWPALEQLLRLDGAQLVVSSNTNKGKLDQGLMLCDEEVCLPVKVLMGHVKWLLRQDIDALFLPRVVSLEKKRYICPKFLGLPDMVRNDLGTSIPIISPTVDLSWNKFRIWRECVRSSRPLLKSPWQLWRNMEAAVRAQSLHQQQLATAMEQSGAGKRVAVLGHAYNIFDEYINFGLLEQLSKQGVRPLTVENFSKEQIEQGAQGLDKDLFWNFGRDVVGAAFYCLKYGIVDGVILVASFGCGPDSLILEIIERRFGQTDIPLMSIILDEHSSGTGLITRVEAFVDMLNWRDVS